MTTTPPSTPTPRRRWLQFSLRTVLIVMLVAGVLLGWLGAKLVGVATFFTTCRTMMREFPQESWKVADVVEAVHEYRRRTGAWPATLSAVVSGRADELAREGWRYEYVPPPDDVATLHLSGPLHMRLLYVFSSPTPTTPNAGWTCTCEGGPVPVPPPPSSRSGS